MKKLLLFSAGCIICLFITACSSGGQDQHSEEIADRSTEESEVNKKSNSVAFSDNGQTAPESAEAKEDNNAVKNAEIDSADRKIIYTANLHIEVKNIGATFEDIQTKVTEQDGYMVESNMYGGSGEGIKSGVITARIPQEYFREFIQLVEKGSSKVVESSVSGQDVTEEYVDLEARLKSKLAVEKRLLTFMEQAEKTEDLLKISENLANVQEEMEELLGRMKYLENKTDLATVTIHLEESNVTLSSMDKDELNTWDKTKQQFLKSINWLLTAFSGIIVFLIGGLPVFILLGIIGLIIFFIIRRVKRKE